MVTFCFTSVMTLFSTDPGRLTLQATPTMTTQTTVTSVRFIFTCDRSDWNRKAQHHTSKCPGWRPKGLSGDCRRMWNDPHQADDRHIVRLMVATEAGN